MFHLKIIISIFAFMQHGILLNFNRKDFFPKLETKYGDFQTVSLTFYSLL